VIDLLKSWQEKGKPVFNVEYALINGNAGKAYSNGKDHGFRTYVTTRLLNRLTSTPPLGMP